MATRRYLQPKLLNDLPYFFRRLGASVPPFTSAAQQAFFAADPDDGGLNFDDRRSTLFYSIVNFQDTQKLFSSVSTVKLMKSTVTLKLASMNWMVDLGTRVLNSKLMENPISKRLVLETIRHTFYDHFCGGENLCDAYKTVERLSNSGLWAMLDYGLEHAADNASCDQNLKEFLRTIEEVGKRHISDSPISFVVVKITAICPPSLLKRVSDLLRWEHLDNSFHLPWKRQIFPLFTDKSAFHHTPQQPEPLNLEEERDLELAYQRLREICENSLQANIPLLIDAEETSIQPAIDYFAYSAAITYHRAADGPLVFNTMQAYLKDAEERLVTIKRAADEMGVQLGFKLVRGAYMSKEREVAKSLGSISPIHDSIEDTHRCYNNCLKILVESVAQGSGSVVLATHNRQSGQLAAVKAIGFGIRKDNPNLHFAQLYGMADALSFGLRNAGFRVSKYLPFGPVEQIMPYLLRRAEENKSLLSASASDRTLMRNELLRRFKCYDLVPAKKTSFYL